MTAKLVWVGTFDDGFQQVPLVKTFWNFHSIVIERQLFKISEEKQKKWIFLIKKNPKIN